MDNSTCSSLDTVILVQSADSSDKGVDQLLGRAGHKQSAGTTEKISDGIRSGFKKLTGRDVPIQDASSPLLEYM